jgi:hypothetical protein
MYFRLFGALAAAGFLFLAPAAADASCCDRQEHKNHQTQTGCCEMPCCKDHQAAPQPGPVAMVFEMDPQLNPAPPVRQLAEVWFHRPVLVGRSILQGRYVIEHDNDRMARGEPCTHIYAYNDRTKPVAAFHCTHLERDRANDNIVVLTPGLDGGMPRLTEFQFAGETASHGYPTVR